MYHKTLFYYVFSAGIVWFINSIGFFLTRLYESCRMAQWQAAEPIKRYQLALWFLTWPNIFELDFHVIIPVGSWLFVKVSQSMACEKDANITLRAGVIHRESGECTYRLQLEPEPSKNKCAGSYSSTCAFASGPVQESWTGCKVNVRYWSSLRQCECTDNLSLLPNPSPPPSSHQRIILFPNLNGMSTPRGGSMDMWFAQSQSLKPLAQLAIAALLSLVLLVTSVVASFFPFHRPPR